MPETYPSPPWQRDGKDLSRVLALSDGIFAFAMTLLVLGLVLPTGFNPSQVNTVLWNLRSEFYAYLLSFFVISFYWAAHHRLFRYISGYDSGLLSLNILFLLFIAVMPFVTNLLAAAGSTRTAVWAYCVVQVGAGGSLLGIVFHATAARRHVDPAFPEAWSRYLRWSAVVSPLVFLGSMPLALLNPALCEYSWVSLFAILGILRRLGH